MKKIDKTIFYEIMNSIVLLAICFLGFYFLWRLMNSVIYKVILIIFVPLLSAFLVEKILSRFVNAVVSFFIKDKR